MVQVLIHSVMLSQSVLNSNRNDTILSGISTQNNQVYFTANIYTGLTAGDTVKAYNYTCDFFAQMDMVLTLENGILSARY